VKCKDFPRVIHPITTPVQLCLTIEFWWDLVRLTTKCRYDIDRTQRVLLQFVTQLTNCVPDYINTNTRNTINAVTGAGDAATPVASQPQNTLVLHFTQIGGAPLWKIYRTPRPTYCLVPRVRAGFITSKIGSLKLAYTDDRIIVKEYLYYTLSCPKYIQIWHE